MPSLEAMLEQCRWALRDEVKAIREGGGQRTYLSDGRYIGQRPGLWVYAFTADSELRLADDTRVDLEYRGKKHLAIILSTHGCDIVHALKSDLGDALAAAMLYTAPRYLLEMWQQLSVEQRASLCYFAVGATHPGPTLLPMTRQQMNRRLTIKH